MESDDDILWLRNKLASATTRACDKVPRLDAKLLVRVVLRDETVPDELVRDVFEYVASDEDWRRAFEEACVARHFEAPSTT
jgi:hypothetical protein